MRNLDRYENIAAGLYRKAIQPVLKAGGGTARAILYVGQGEGGRPQPSYMEAVVAAARDWALPETYIRALENFLPRNGVAAGPVSAVPRKTR
jgi:hypothetical protein